LCEKFVVGNNGDDVDKKKRKGKKRWSNGTLFALKVWKTFVSVLVCTLYFYWRWQKVVDGDGTNELHS